MKFLTKELIARLDVLIEERDAAERAHNTKEQEKADEAQSKWLNKYGAAYALLADRIRVKIDNGKPVTQDDVPEGLHDRYGRFRGFYSDYKPNLISDTSSELRTLRAALQSVTDEEVTTTGLRDIGFRDIARLFRAPK